MKFTIFRPTQTKELAISWLEAHTSVGSFVIQIGHVPTILMLQPDKPLIIMMNSGKQDIIPIDQNGGLLHIDRNSTTLLLSS